MLSLEGGRGFHSFSFRCAGESFDESPYAKIVADALGTKHSVIEYGPEDILQIEKCIPLMDEPFCDLGINVATYLLGRSAADGSIDIFTGDGGDELFGGHPVYLADRVARVVDSIPGMLKNPFLGLGRRLRDSDRKKDWRVKLGRFARSYRFPESLGTHRWRVYYEREDLHHLFQPELLNEESLDRVFFDVIEYNQEIETRDALARSLYSDYQTVVQFYLRRLEMIESMGLHPRFPMLDPDIVRFCAAIPSRYKIKGASDTKYIEKKVLEPWLPHAVVHRKDKLGHSIPMKNWMRENRTVKTFMRDLLSPQTLKNTGFFQPDTVERMIMEHQERLQNHSHRLWALMVLQLWLNHAALI